MSKNDMPPLIWAEQRDGLSGAHMEGGVWINIQLTESYTPYIHADLVREAIEALATARAWMIPGMNWTDETGAKIKADAETALSKLKEAGL